MNKIKSSINLRIRDSKGIYRAIPENNILESAKDHIHKRFNSRMKLDLLQSAKITKEYLSILLANNTSESFYCIYLDTQHRVILSKVEFTGTIDGAVVHPREIVKQALLSNANAVIFAHNHPSGCSEPSQADINITRRLNSALALIDVSVLDHIVVGDEVVSFAERGLL